MKVNVFKVLFIAVFSMSGIYALEPQQGGWGTYILSFFKRSTATQAPKSSILTENIISRNNNFFGNAKLVPGYETSKLYSSYRLYNEEALTQLSEDFISLCREYITFMRTINPSEVMETVKQLLAKRTLNYHEIRGKVETIVQLRELRSKFAKLISKYVPNGNACLCPGPEDSTLQKMFKKISDIIEETEGALLYKADPWTYDEGLRLHEEISKTMLECNSGRVLVEQLKNIIQQVIISNGIYAPMLRKAVTEVIDPYLQSTKGRCK